MRRKRGVGEDRKRRKGVGLQDTCRILYIELRDKYNGRSTDKIRTKKARDRPRGIAV